MTTDTRPANDTTVLELSLGNDDEETILTFALHAGGVATFVRRPALDDESFDDECFDDDEECEDGHDGRPRAVEPPGPVAVHATLAEAVGASLPDARAALDPPLGTGEDEDPDDLRSISVTCWHGGADELVEVLVEARTEAVFVTFDRATAFFDGRELGAPPPNLSADDLVEVWSFHCGVEAGGPWTREVHEIVGTWEGRYFYVDRGDSGDDVPVCVGVFDDVLEGVAAALGCSDRDEHDRLELWSRSEEGEAEKELARASLEWDEILDRLRERTLALHSDAAGMLHRRARCLRALQRTPVVAVATEIDDLLEAPETACCPTCLKGLTGFLEIVREIEEAAGLTDSADGEGWQPLVMRASSGPLHLVEDLVGSMVYRWTAVDAVRFPIILATTVPPEVVELVERVGDLADEEGFDFAYEVDETFVQDSEVGPGGLPRRFLGGFLDQRSRPDGARGRPARVSMCSPARRAWGSSAGDEPETDWGFPALCAPKERRGRRPPRA
jgi:hypothetical protein